MAILMDAIRLGPAVFPPALVAVFVSFFLSLIFLNRCWKSRGYDGDEQTGILLEAVLVGYVAVRIATWAAGSQMEWEGFRTFFLSLAPTYTYWVGVAAGMIYLLWRAYRKRVLSWLWIEALLLPISCAIVSYSLLLPDFGKVTSMPWGVYGGGELFVHPLNLYRALAFAFAAVWIVRAQVRPFRRVLGTAIAFSLATLVVSWFEPHLTVYLGFALVQWILLASCSILAWVLTYSKSVV